MMKIGIEVHDPEQLVIVNGEGDVSARISKGKYDKLMVMQETCCQLQQELGELWKKGLKEDEL